LEHLAIALSKTSKILELDLSFNDVGPQNFSLLQRIFKSNIYLELLNLANCGINGEETANLCEGLLLNQSLKYLYLRNNELRDEGSEAISKLILTNQSMIELDLYNCKINESGGNLIGTALK
jgi:Ran GTPase-activating protein (RanGAP) involved in mRNA processing and transport